MLVAGKFAGEMPHEGVVGRDVLEHLQAVAVVLYALSL